MKKILIFLFFTFSIIGQSQAQIVTTILNSDTADVDDALALDSQGNLYGSNWVGDSVYKITPSGDVSVFASGFNHPNGLAFDSADNLFIVDYGAGTIYKYDINGNQLDSFYVGGYPSGLIKDHASDVMIYTNVADSSVNKLSNDGTITVLHQGAPLRVPVGLAFDRSGELYVGNYVGRQIYHLPSTGEAPEYVATVPDSGTNFPYLAFIAYANGRLFGTVYGEHKIYKIHPNKIDHVEVYAGSSNGNTDGDISGASFAYPAGMVANRQGSLLYVSEFSGLGNIRKISRGNKDNTSLEKKHQSLTNDIPQSFE
jgi:hypothetical protein